MQFKTISYSESRETLTPIGLRNWRRVATEVEIGPGEDANEAYRMAEESVKGWLDGGGAINPDTKSIQSGNPVNPLPIENRAVERISIGIENAKTIDELLKLKQGADFNGLQDKYAEKFIKLATLNKKEQKKSYQNK